ncbi:MAG: hypothetical protein OXC62_09150 [Aestuariivita sp.]|nr:hypothetical protein [Aestuariivita sp.]
MPLVTRGNPEQPLLWTLKSSKKLMDELSKQGFCVSIPTVLEILKEEGYSLQPNAKTQEKRWNPDHDQQCHHINPNIKAFSRQATGYFG